jgi:hypothetical protein
MTDSTPISTARATAFIEGRIVAAGPLDDVAASVRRALDAEPRSQPLVFDDATGRVVDLDLRGTPAEAAARYARAEATRAGRGRPKLGVVAREVTLLPRHWDWLGAQPGGASAALRRLVEQASRAPADGTQRRARQEAAYRFLAATAGDLPGFEEACRALFARDRSAFLRRAEGWPPDVVSYADALAWPEPESP